MLKDTDKYEASAHFTYNEYKRKVHKSPNKDVMVFFSVFVIGVLIILGFVKILSPNVDVAIDVDNEVATVDYDEDTSATSVVDERLRRLKLEDEGKQEGDEEMFSPELDEKVVLPNKHTKTVGEIEAEKANLLNVKEMSEVNDNAKAEEQAESIQSHKESKTQPAKKSQPMPDQIINAKVVVGSYATEKQAEVAKSIIQDAGLGVTPIVKNFGGYYTLQVGAYTSREKAQQAANNLLKSNFPARVVVE